MARMRANGGRCKKKINRRTNEPKRKCSCSDEHVSNKKSFLKISKTFHLKIQFTATECFVTDNNCNRTSNEYWSTIKLGKVFITIQHNSIVSGVSASDVTSSISLKE